MKSLLFSLILTFYSSASFGQDSLAINSTIHLEPIYTIVDEMPRYPNGEKALRDTFAKYMQYPTYEWENRIKGTVILRFVVTEKGAIEKIEVLKKVTDGLDSEALRLMRLIPSFIPGKQQGKEVKVAYVLPVLFKIP